MSPGAYSLPIPECQYENGIVQQASIWVKESFRFEGVWLRIPFRVVQDCPCVSDYNCALWDQESFVNVVLCDCVRDSCDGDYQLICPSIHWWTYREERQAATLKLLYTLHQRRVGVGDPQMLGGGPVL